MIPSNIRKNKGTFKCDKNTVTCDVGTAQCEDDTMKCEKKIREPLNAKKYNHMWCWCCTMWGWHH